MKIILNLLGVGWAAAQDSASGVKALTGGGLIPKCLADPEKVRTAGASCITESITHFTSLLLLGVAVGSFIYLLYGAFLYATAFGDEKKVEQGKRSITYALIGVIIAALSNFIIRLLQNALKAP
jgi:hypothetical protein